VVCFSVRGFVLRFVRS